MAKSKIFAIGDVHGCLNPLKELVSLLPLGAESTLVFLGDYVDRGPDSRGVIDYLIELKEKFNVVTLKGNHEAMFLDFLERPESAGAALFIMNGGSSTLASYATGGGHFDVPDSHIEFLSDCPTYYETDEFFFVHAGVKDFPLKKIQRHKEDTLLWIRDSFLNSDYDWGKKIIHGHTPVDQVTVKQNRINLDTGCVFGGKLSAVELPKEKIYQVTNERKPEPAYLLDTQMQRVARRFVGAVEVFVVKDGQVCGFETLNYNQFGLLIREVSPTAEPFLKVGEDIEGVIGQNPLAQVSFKGKVVRMDPRSSIPMYGVKIAIS